MSQSGSDKTNTSAITDHTIMRTLADSIEVGQPVVLATVIRTDRSVPRRAGSKMLVWADGRQIGTVGGGEMESRVVAEATDALTDGRSRVLDYDLVDPSTGDPGVCGGTVTIHMEPFMSRPTVLVVGCGHVGRAVIDLAHWLGYRVVAVDDRAELADPSAVPNADAVIMGSIAEALEAEPVNDQTHAVLVTRSVALDLETIPPLLASPVRSIGVMGSVRRWDTTSGKLRDAGTSDEDLERVTAPIGVEIHAETPEEIALSIMGQIIADRRTPLPD